MQPPANAGCTFFFFSTSGMSRMAADAQSFAFLQQQRLGVGLMRGVAGGAVSGGNGTVNDLEVDVIRVTGPAQILHRLHQQLGLIRRVRIVARRAHPLLDRRMNIALRPESRSWHV